MLKEALGCLGVGSACLSLALVSTHFSSLDNSSAELSKPSGGMGKKIEKINSYGEIDAYGLQNGCFFRIVDKAENKVYTLTDFLTAKQNKIPTLEKDVVKVAEEGRRYCGKEIPIVTIFHEKKQVSLRNLVFDDIIDIDDFVDGDTIEIDEFRFERSPIITDQEKR